MIVESSKKTHSTEAAELYMQPQALQHRSNATAPTFTPSKPILPEHLVASVTPQALIFSKMFDQMQQYVTESSEPAELKQDYMGRKITENKKALRQAEKAILDTQGSVKTWEGRKKIASYLCNAVTILTGMGLVASGQAVAGGSLIASGTGSTLSDILQRYGCNSTVTSALSIASGIVGLAGGLGSLGWGLITNPRNTVQALNSGALGSFFQKAGALTSFFGNGASLYASAEKNKGLKKTSELAALHTKIDTALRSLDQKLSGAYTSFQGKAKDFSQIFKSISRAQSRYIRDAMRVFTADFPA